MIGSICRNGTTIVAVAALLFAAIAPGGTLDRAYIDPAYVTTVPFGGRSHWIQPWRGYLETVPATTFVRAVGVNYGASRSDKGENPELIVQMLAKYGISNARIEIGWGNLNYDDDSKINGAARFQDALRRLVRYGIRPMILLNSHHGVPCPCVLFRRKVTADAAKGDTTVQLDDVSGLIVGHSGLSQLTDYWAAEAIITNIDGNTVTLSKPLPKAIAAGTMQGMATLKYLPFGPPDAPDTAITMAGWQHYVLTVARLAVDALGTADADDKGFDMEIWNELTFGHNFLCINKYYGQKIADYNWEKICPRIVAATADVVKDNPKLFSGVTFCDGFSNTTPWAASSAEPPQIMALSHHPYHGVTAYPDAAGKGNSYNALLQVEKKTVVFEPTYTAWFPEYFGTLLQTEHSIRDAGPITTPIGSARHGRWGRDPEASGKPFQTWFTETGMGPDEAGIKNRAQALELKAKAVARNYCFWINKGVTKLEIYAACDRDLGLGLVQDNFIEYSKTHDDYPADDREYVSPVLQTVGRIVSRMRQDMDVKLTGTVPIQIETISDEHDHVQFHGDGTAAHPDLFNRDVLAILPFQVNAHRLVIAYYVMTRDLRIGLPPEDYTVQISGLAGQDAKISAYDPLHDADVPVGVNAATDHGVNLKLRAADYPYLLTIDLAAK